VASLPVLANVGVASAFYSYVSHNTFWAQLAGILVVFALELRRLLPLCLGIPPRDAPASSDPRRGGPLAPAWPELAPGS
jgi:hypothetical protein